MSRNSSFLQISASPITNVTSVTVYDLMGKGSYNVYRNKNWLSKINMKSFTLYSAVLRLIWNKFYRPNAGTIDETVSN